MHNARSDPTSTRSDPTSTRSDPTSIITAIKLRVSALFLVYRRLGCRLFGNPTLMSPENVGLTIEPLAQPTKDNILICNKLYLNLMAVISTIPF